MLTDTFRSSHLDYASRRLLSAKDHRARDESKSRLEMEMPVVKNDSLEEGKREIIAGSVDINGFRPRGRRLFQTVARVLASCYCFWMLAIICDEYFIGSIDVICQSLLLRLRPID